MPQGTSTTDAASDFTHCVCIDQARLAKQLQAQDNCRRNTTLSSAVRARSSRAGERKLFALDVLLLRCGAVDPWMTNLGSEPKWKVHIESNPHVNARSLRDPQ
jgi:hypothetical protein